MTLMYSFKFIKEFLTFFVSFTKINSWNSFPFAQSIEQQSTLRLKKLVNELFLNGLNFHRIMEFLNRFFNVLL